MILEIEEEESERFEESEANGQSEKSKKEKLTPRVVLLRTLNYFYWYLDGGREENDDVEVEFENEWNDSSE